MFKKEMPHPGKAIANHGHREHPEERTAQHRIGDDSQNQQ